MNQKLKFLLVVTLMLLLTTGCENDNFNENTHKQQERRLNINLTSWEEFKVHHDNIASKVVEFRKNRTSKNINESNKYGFYINDSKIQVIENDNFTTFTFFVYRDNPNPNILENYTYKEYKDGTFEQFLIKYHYTIDNNGNMIFDTNILDVEIIEDSNLVVLKNSCMPEFVEVLDEIVCTSNTQCTGAGHNPGEECDCTPSPDTCDPAGSMFCELQYVWVYQGCGGGEDSTPPDGNNPTTNTGGGGSSNNDDNSNNTPSVPVIVPTPIYQPIEDCINDPLSFKSSDNSTINPEILKQLEFSIAEWAHNLLLTYKIIIAVNKHNKM
ncbi:hypothetical protein [Flavobacterium sp. CS20]|uniref:hypothetical protein n=1 Tax=Flavobacterium sp. CS20 TaxID=2775246 RepID=UPI001B39D64C|nr:hypothetical protein [Flavobacterium sp. CS20]QTY27799.1 hypothetical protein IGB25_04570 [Flavobacterium sp. CS20]